MTFFIISNNIKTKIQKKSLQFAEFYLSSAAQKVLIPSSSHSRWGNKHVKHICTYLIVVF